MSLKRCLLVVLLIFGLATAAFIARESEPTTGSRMIKATDDFLAALTPEQQKKATFAFEDKERLRWYFTPQQAKRMPTRKGLYLAEMSDKQKALAKELLKAGTSETGYKQVTTIVALESVLKDLEKGGAMVREADWYFVSVFGTPGKGKWGWRFEGHHLSLNFTLEGDKIVTTTPFFLGANPAEVKSGKFKGTIALPESMNLFRDLLATLDADQRETAKVKNLFKDVDESSLKPSLPKQVGLSVTKMNDKQKAALEKLITAYAERMPMEVAKAELAAIRKAGMDKISFAYGMGDGTPGKPYQYRVHGPTFLIEFINEQADGAKNPANHIHSIWRKIDGDFGL